METLLELGGFPEPFFTGQNSFWKRWSLQHRDLILTEDIRDLTRVVEIDKISTLMEMIIPAVGNTTSNKALGDDLETSHANVKRWLEILHKVHLIFPVTPYSKNIRRAYKQEKKWYCMDWCLAKENVFENYVAASLLRAVALYTDRYCDSMSVHFVRTHDQTEVDFLLCKNKKPWLLVEAKEGAPEISRGVYRFAHELKVSCVVVTKKRNVFKKITGKEGQKIICVSWSKFGAVLP